MTFDKRTPRNTADIDNTDRMAMLLEAMAGGSTRLIEGQEAQGQASFVSSTTLPTKCRPEDIAALEAAGVVFGDVVPGDDLFRYVTLPDGWTRQGTDHSMHSKLLDDKGRERASIFYKAAFYDRRADMYAVRRYSAAYDYAHFDAAGQSVARVHDGGTEIWATEPDPWETAPEKDYERSGLASDVACKWLDENFPQWREAAAYWGDES